MTAATPRSAPTAATKPSYVERRALKRQSPARRARVEAATVLYGLSVVRSRMAASTSSRSKASGR